MLKLPPLLSLRPRNSTDHNDALFQGFWFPWTRPNGIRSHLSRTTLHSTKFRQPHRQIHHTIHQTKKGGTKHTKKKQNCLTNICLLFPHKQIIILGIYDTAVEEGIRVARGALTLLDLGNWSYTLHCSSSTQHHPPILFLLSRDPPLTTELVEICICLTDIHVCEESNGVTTSYDIFSNSDFWMAGWHIGQQRQLEGRI